jgi:hypothetical protein
MACQMRLIVISVVVSACGFSPVARGGPSYGFVLEQVQEIAPNDYYYYFDLQITSGINIVYDSPANLIFQNELCPPLKVISTPTDWYGGIPDPGIVNFLYQPVTEPGAPEPIIYGPADIGPFVVEFHCPDTGGGYGTDENTWNLLAEVNGSPTLLSGDITVAPEPSTLVLSGTACFGLLGYLAYRRHSSARQKRGRR